MMMSFYIFKLLKFIFSSPVSCINVFSDTILFEMNNVNVFTFSDLMFF